MSPPLHVETHCPQCGTQNRINFESIRGTATGDRTVAIVDYAGRCTACRAELHLTVSATAVPVRELLDQTLATLDRVRHRGDGP